MWLVALASKGASDDTRAQARKACISDDNRTPGWMGVIW